MRQFRILVFLLLAIPFAHTAYSQCCCSGPEVTITDDGGIPLRAEDVKVKELGEAQNSRIHFKKGHSEAKFRFRVGCGTGKEVLIIESMGVEMRVRFKLHGEFGTPRVDIMFSPGDHVAEFSEERDDEGAEAVVLRPATAEEMKEVEPPEPADAATDQTAQTS